MSWSSWSSPGIFSNTSISDKLSPMILIAFRTSSSEMTSGGAKRILKCQLKSHHDPQHLHVNVGRLRQQTLALHQQAQLPCGSTLLGHFLVDYNTVEQSSSADNLDERRVEVSQALPEDFAETLRAVCEILLDEHIKSGHSDGTAERVAKMLSLPVKDQ